MTPPWVRLLFSGETGPFYRVTLLGSTCIEQWTTYGGEEDGLHRLRFLAVIDRAVLGTGTGRIPLRGDLWCTADLAPVRYRLQDPGGETAMTFADDAVTVRFQDGTVQRVARGGADFLADGNFPATTALVYAALAGSTPPPAPDRLNLRLFVANAVVTVPYETSPLVGEAAACGWHRTSHRSEVRLDEGRLAEARLPEQGLAIALVDTPPPVPAWPDLLAPDTPPPVYRSRPGARLRLLDLTIEGPVTPIGATLSLPSGAEGPWPGLLFLGGSGTHDRHGIAGGIDIGTHEIMDGLAEQGFVGLRYDSRGAGSTRLGDDILDHGLSADIADARACLAWLRARPEVAGRPIFLIGHSQGGTIALVLGSGPEAAPRLGGLVLMATMGRDLDEVLIDQVAAHGSNLGFDAPMIAAQTADARHVAALIRAGVPWDGDHVPHHLLAVFRSRTWYEDFLRYPAAALIGGVAVPILLCQGGEDFQVSPERDAEALRAAARQAGCDCTYAFFPGLDHLFKRSRGASSLAEYAEPRPVAPEVIERLRAWLSARAATPPDDGGRVTGGSSPPRSHGSPPAASRRRRPPRPPRE